MQTLEKVMSTGLFEAWRMTNVTLKVAKLPSQLFSPGSLTADCMLDCAAHLRPSTGIGCQAWRAGVNEPCLCLGHTWAMALLCPIAEIADVAGWRFALPPAVLAAHP